MANLQELENYRNIYFIGIGGTSMSGIAEILNHSGFNVAGSDVSASAATDKLIEHGIHVTIGHNPNNLQGCDLVVYTAAVKDDDPELSAAREQGIPTVDRSVFLGLLTKAYRDTISIAGTHGKSTTTSMVSMCFLEAGLDPSIQLGADLPAIEGNYRIGKSEYFIVESCEYVESFLHFFPKAEIILNIDNDHLDYFHDIEHITEAFVKFVKLLPDDGLLVYNADDERQRGISHNTKAKSVTFGINKSNANYVGKNISFDKDGCATFDVYHNNVFYKTFKLSVPGKHNVLNALACIALCDTYKLDKNDIKNGLMKFTGTGRRFEYVGTINNAKIYDDYGHHPTELEAVANAVKSKEYNHSWIVFQPHTYTRTKAHLEEFAKVLMNYDNIIVTDIYAARETDTLGISSKDIVDLIDQAGRKALYIPNLEDVVDYLRRYALPDDIIITQGAGTITKVGHVLVGDIPSISLPTINGTTTEVSTIDENKTNIPLEERADIKINNEPVAQEEVDKVIEEIEQEEQIPDVNIASDIEEEKYTDEETKPLVNQITVNNVVITEDSLKSAIEESENYNEENEEKIEKQPLENQINLNEVDNPMLNGTGSFKNFNRNRFSLNRDFNNFKKKHKKRR